MSGGRPVYYPFYPRREPQGFTPEGSNVYSTDARLNSPAPFEGAELNLAGTI